MRSAFVVVGSVLAAVACAPTAPAQEPVPAQGLTAQAELRDRDGRPVGNATLTETPHGVLIWTELFDLPPGSRAIHIHEAGVCEPPFQTAGGHFNPHGRGHGFLDPEGKHVGDLPNIHIGPDGRATIELLASEATLRPGPASLLREGGTSLVIHEGRDDYVSDPAGDAGGRIACGVIRG